jgi:hypothetical protein
VELWHYSSAYHHSDVIFPCLVIDLWSRQMVALDVAEQETPTIAADLIGIAFIR